MMVAVCSDSPPSNVRPECAIASRAAITPNCATRSIGATRAFVEIFQRVVVLDLGDDFLGQLVGGKNSCWPRQFRRHPPPGSTRTTGAYALWRRRPRNRSRRHARPFSPSSAVVDTQRAAHAVCSPPPCGEGLGVGVERSASALPAALPPPPTLPHKGGGS